MSRAFHHIYNTPRWRTLRRLVFARDGWVCKSCGKPGALECDHVTPLHVKPDQDFYALENLQTLCRGCHIEKTKNENQRKPTTPEALAWGELVSEMMG